MRSRRLINLLLTAAALLAPYGAAAAFIDSQNGGALLVSSYGAASRLPVADNPASHYPLTVTLIANGASYTFNGLTLSSIAVDNDSVGVAALVADLNVTAQFEAITIDDSQKWVSVHCWEPSNRCSER